MVYQFQVMRYDLILLVVLMHQFIHAAIVEPTIGAKFSHWEFPSIFQQKGRISGKEIVLILLLYQSYFKTSLILFSIYM
jgi:hypothetical protein